MPTFSMVHCSAANGVFLFFNLCQCLDFRQGIRLKFGLRDFADCHIIFCERNVVQLVQITENRHLTELCHAGDEDKFQMIIARFQIAEKSLEQSTVLLMVFTLTFQKRFIVFVNKNDDRQPHLFVHRLKKVYETLCK